MKRLLLIFLLCPLLVVAQRTEWDLAYTKSIPPGLGEPIHLPKRDYNPNFTLADDFSSKERTRVITIKADSIYKKFFWRYIYTKDSLAKYKRNGADKYNILWVEQHLVDSLPVIDFSKYELVLYTACAQCLAFCHHDEGRDNCHRNGCSFRESWFIREKNGSALKNFDVDKKINDPFSKLLRDTSFKPANLPLLSHSELVPFFKTGGFSTYRYLINNDSLYYAVFSRFPKASLPSFDFSRQELWASISCAQCLITCHSYGRYNRPCHRNACRYNNVWYVRDKDINGSASLKLQ